MNRYFTERVTAIEAIGGRRVRVTFQDGWTGEVDLTPLLDCGPIFERLRDEASFNQVTVAHGAALWPDDLDLSPGALRAWCEAGRFMDYGETDGWIAEHIRPPETVAPAQ
ncbi:MAG: DUF2442 domain-containing protein [Chthoniobacteraceae bacterium]|jgi:hypothetical protein